MLLPMHALNRLNAAGTAPSKLSRSHLQLGSLPSLGSTRLPVTCRLVEEYPEHVVAWFAVGCYYQSIGRYDSARQYFGKATAMDPSFAPAWLGFGHAFAAQDESDQVCSAPALPFLGQRLGESP